MTAPRGRLLPEVPALVTWDAGTLEILDVARRSTMRAEGIFADEVRRLLETGERGPALAALSVEHPLLQMVDGAGKSRSAPLDASTALGLDGFRTLFLELTGCCNQRCLQCYAGAGPDVASALDWPGALAAVEDAAALGFELVQLTGGEPLLCTFLPQMVERVVALGMTCEIYTNGLLLDDALLDAIAPYGPAFALSYYSHRPEVHDAITRTPGSHASTTRAIERVQARGLPLRAAMIVVPQNAADIQGTVARLGALGVLRVGVGRSFAVGRGELFLGEVAHPCAADDPADGAPQTRRRGRLCVAHDGTVYPCIFNRTDPLGQIAERRLLEIARAPALRAPPEGGPAGRLEQVRRSVPCLDCQLTACALAALAGEGGI